jgi:hypothetical protein
MLRPVLAETFELFVSLIFQFFSGGGKPRITETAVTESMDTGEGLQGL